MKTYYWSRKPETFLDKTTGNKAIGATFTGSVREWYETLIETIIDISSGGYMDMSEEAFEERRNIFMSDDRSDNWYEADIFKTCPRGELTLKVGPSVATVLEASVLYKPNLGGTGGSLNNRFCVVLLDRDVVDENRNHEVKVFEDILGDDQLIGVVKVSDMNVI